MELDLNQKEEYKETELGLLPNDWEVVRLGDVITPDRSKIRREDYKGDISIVQKISFDTGQIDFRNKRTTRTDLYVADRDHLLISKINFHQGAVAITNTLTAATTHYEFYKVSDKADIFYLWRYFRTDEFKNIFYQEIKFRGFKKEANFKFIKNFKIPLPPLSEQKKIAYVLSAVQEAKEKTEDVIKATKELKKSMMKYLFTYGPVNLEEAEKVPLKETEIGLIPEEWEVVRLGDVFEFSRKPRSLSMDKNQKLPFIPMELISEDKKRVDGWQIKVFSEVPSGTFILKKDLIVAKITPSFENGKQAILDNLPADYGYATTEIWALHPKNEKAIVEHLYSYLKIPSIREDLASKMEGTTGRQRLPRYVLENFKIPLPPLSEQKKIASILSAIDQKIEAEENKKKALEDLFKSLLHNLMTAKIRVNHLEKILD